MKLCFQAKRFRLFSTQPILDKRLDLLKGSVISPDQIHVKPGKQAEPDKVKLTYEERFKEMKETFGPNYTSPDQKYDLSIPKGEAMGEKPADERHMERQGFKKGRNVMLSAVFGTSLLCFLVLHKYYYDQKEELEVVERKQLEDKYWHYQKYGMTEAEKEKRLSELAKIKQEYKEKFGVELDESSLSS